MAVEEYVLFFYILIQSLYGKITNPCDQPADYTYNIPKCIPNGVYLLRIQSLAIHNPGSTPQWYVSCAQVNVTGGGNATPAPTVKIPGAFKASDPGYTANVSLSFLLLLVDVREILLTVVSDLQQLQVVYRPRTGSVQLLGGWLVV